MFIAQEVSTEFAGLVLKGLGKVPAAYRDLADQARRAATSVALNVAEGNGRKGQDRTHHFSIAYASAREATVALQLLAAVGVVGEGDYAHLTQLVDRVKALTWRLSGR
jgi:four helix bundle protein